MTEGYRWSKQLFLTLLAAGVLAGMSGLAAAKPPKNPAATFPAQYEEEEGKPPPGFRGLLDIRIQSGSGRLHPPGELVISNSSGETLGFDPRYHYTYREIAGGSYRRAVIPGRPSIEEAVLHINDAAGGVYSLRVIGTGYGQYRLIMKGYDREVSHADLLFTIMIQPGEVHHYLINYDNVGGVSLRARRTRTRD
jgi:hypothetical protein